MVNWTPPRVIVAVLTGLSTIGGVASIILEGFRLLAMAVPGDSGFGESLAAKVALQVMVSFFLGFLGVGASGGILGGVYKLGSMARKRWVKQRESKTNQV